MLRLKKTIKQWVLMNEWDIFSKNCNQLALALTKGGKELVGEDLEKGVNSPSIEGNAFYICKIKKLNLNGRFVKPRFLFH